MKMPPLLWLWSLAWWRLVSPSCLPSSTEGFVPETDRLNITIGSFTGPIGFTGPYWESAVLYNAISIILIQEILGYHAVQGRTSGTIAGTYDIAANDPDIHVATELWDYLIGPYKAQFDLANPEKAQDQFKTMGVLGTDGMYVFPAVFEQYYHGTGRSLEYYKDLNASWGDYSSYFTRPEDISVDDLTDCNLARLVGQIPAYLALTGDTDAVETVDGLQRWKCYNQDRWWLSPSCRSTPSTCATYTTYSSWGYEGVRQKAAAFNIPVAMGNLASWGAYVNVPKTKNVFTYWWYPDATFKAEGAIKTLFPPYRADEVRRGIYTSDASDVKMYQTADVQLGNVAPNVMFLLTAQEVFNADIDASLEEMMRLTSQGSTNALGEAACTWVQQNQDRWRSWIPIVTACNRGKGYGMVTDMGEFVDNRSDAHSCGLCSPGRFADGYTDADGNSAICSTCAPGTAQEQGAQTECAVCGAGTFSHPAGTRCSRCSRGSYQELPSQTSCSNCKVPMTTTTVGMTSEADCVCPAGTFRPCHDIDDNGALRSECHCDISLYLPASGISQRCMTCLEGMECREGSDEKYLPCNETAIMNSTVFPYPVPAEGYFVSWEQPMWVFQCIDLPSCPGNMASNCGEGLQGAACGACAPGFYKQAGQCYKCGDLEKSPLFLIIPLLFSPVVVWVLHKVSQDDVTKWGKTTQGFGGIGYLMLVYVQSVSVILAVFPTVPNTLQSGLGWSGASAEITSLFRIECAGPSGFSENFVFNLFLPELVGVVFFVSWLLCLLLSRFSPKLRMDGDIVMGCFGGILKTFFVTVASKCFSLFQCYRHPNGERSMRSSPQVLEFSDDWTSMVGVAAVAILINCVGLLLLFGWAMWVAPRKFHLVSFRRRWKFMVQKMRPSVHWWMMVILIKGLWLAVTSVIWSTPMTQSLWICAGLLLYFTGSYILLPWRSVFVAILDIAMHVSILLLCLLLPFLLEFGANEARVASTIFLMLAVIAFTAVSTCVLYVLYKAISPFYKQRRDRKLNYYARRFAEVFSVAVDPRILADLMGDIPALDILELKYVASMMSSEILGEQVPRRLVWGEDARMDREADKFINTNTRTQVTFA